MKEVLGIFKARKNGNSISLTIPKSLNIKPNDKFRLELSDDGKLIYSRIKSDNPWENGSYDGYDFKGAMDSLDFAITNKNLIGKENPF